MRTGATALIALLAFVACATAESTPTATLEPTPTATVTPTATPALVEDVRCDYVFGQPTPAEGGVLSNFSARSWCATVGDPIDMQIWALHWLGQRDIAVRMSFELPQGLSAASDEVTIERPAESARSYVELTLSGDEQGLAQKTFRISMSGDEPNRYDVTFEFEWREIDETQWHDFSRKEITATMAFFDES